MPRSRTRRSADCATASTSDGSHVIRLHEDDVARIAEAVLSALRRDRLVDDVARVLRDRLTGENGVGRAIPELSLIGEVQGRLPHAGRQSATSIKRAADWLRRHRVREAGLRPFPRHKAGLGITGHSITTLYALGEKAIARDLADWLALHYRSNGGREAPSRRFCPLCTAHVADGFLAALADGPHLEDPLRQACDALEAWVLSGGQTTDPSCEACNPCVRHAAPGGATLGVLPALLRAGERLGERRYVSTARRVLGDVLSQADLKGPAAITGCCGQWLQALLDLGQLPLAQRGLAQAAAMQRVDGSIAISSDAGWVCTTGVAQLAMAWYQAGNAGTGDRAVAFLEKAQNPTGGFWGSYGDGAQYDTAREVAWAVKFFLDAYLLRIRADFEREVPRYPETISENDGRLLEVLSFVREAGGSRLMDVGCGKGRFLKALHGRFPQISLYGIDLVESMLRSCPDGVETKRGTMLDIPYPDGYFDAVLSVEALEHAVMVENAVREMVRVLRPGGAILIIDKSLAKRRTMKTKPWEQWFSPTKVLSMLHRAGVTARHKELTTSTHEWPDGLFIAWQGRKAGPQ